MKEKKSVRTMDIILAVIAVFLLLFIVVMVWLYYQTGAIPDTPRCAPLPREWHTA